MITIPPAARRSRPPRRAPTASHCTFIIVGSGKYGSTHDLQARVLYSQRPPLPATTTHTHTHADTHAHTLAHTQAHTQARTQAHALYLPFPFVHTVFRSLSLSVHLLFSLFLFVVLSGSLFLLWRIILLHFLR